ncbi:RHS repeat-associated core domain-containing protein [Pedobacter alluvionis]|uniref:RHS repeat-associated core domain-containing protein n=1 Tax=Pedobacter alluvionis TaxID=475253 RepID=UPI00141B6CAA|nr:RHS repeat-associated core domain-containing protein [Pedobacter alluvionis]
MQVGEAGFCNYLYQGQTLDTETGLAYNRFRYYAPEEGTYISQDPIGLAGNNPTVYGYVKDTSIWIDVFGLVPNVDKANQDVYGLYRQGEKDPYYIGISQDADVRLDQHERNGRFDPETDEMRLFHEDLPYAQARAYEQLYIEKYDTIKKTNPKSNQQNSFVKERSDPNGKEYKEEYDKIKSGCQK